MLVLKRINFILQKKKKDILSSSILLLGIFPIEIIIHIKIFTITSFVIAKKKKGKNIRPSKEEARSSHCVAMG